MIRDVVLVGLGAVGTVVGHRLRDVARLRVAADAARVEKFAQQGLWFNGRRCEFELFTPSSTQSEVDLIVMAVKFGGLESSLDLIAPLVGPNTLILPLLNGISAHPMIVQRYGASRVLRGIYIGHTATRYENRITHDGTFKILFGRDTNTPPHDSAVATVDALFTRAGIDHAVPEDMVHATWRKFIANIGLNQTTALLRCTYGHIMQNTNAQQLMRSLMTEAARVGEAVGVAGTMQMVEDSMAMLGKLNTEDGSSMYQDVMAGRETEVEMFASVVCRLGRTYGIDTPLNCAVEKIMISL